MIMFFSQIFLSFSPSGRVCRRFVLSLLLLLRQLTTQAITITGRERESPIIWSSVMMAVHQGTFSALKCELTAPRA